jgi:hypothetical protein
MFFFVLSTIPPRLVLSPLTPYPLDQGTLGRLRYFVGYINLIAPYHTFVQLFKPNLNYCAVTMPWTALLGACHPLESDYCHPVFFVGFGSFGEVEVEAACQGFAEFTDGLFVLHGTIVPDSFHFCSV